jgi:hypothetical protein
MNLAIQSIITNGISLITFVLAAYLVIPLATKMLHIVLKPYKAEHQEVGLLEKYLLGLTWLIVLSAGLGRIGTLVPTFSPIVAVLRPAITGIEDVFDALRWLAVCCTLLIVGRHVARRS